eukprot:TRINITY_DN4589_c0_g1_i2.p3 TRINITY_DN4589_c0_g1~~TRINITY_DN4589_c0_g1_i2.p3  ORF type:complete len:178 (+),score=32.43 TRINITY_DN4589_c0_g1_i2:1673-2206(+)
MYGVLPYYLTKSLVEVPFQLLIPILFSLIVFWAVGFRRSVEMYFLFLAGLMLLVFFGNSLGILLSSMFSNVRSAFTLLPIVIIPMQLFAGYMSNVNTIVSWLRWLQYLSPIRYTLEVFFRAEYKESDFDPNDQLNSYPVDSYSFSIGLGWCYIIMALISVGARILTYFFLKMQTINT